MSAEQIGESDMSYTPTVGEKCRVVVPVCGRALTAEDESVAAYVLNRVCEEHGFRAFNHRLVSREPWTERVADVVPPVSGDWWLYTYEAEATA